MYVYEYCSLYRLDLITVLEWHQIKQKKLSHVELFIPGAT